MGHNPAVPHHTRYVSLLRLRTLVHRHLVRRDLEDDALVGVELRGEGGVIGIGLPAVGGSNSAGGPNDVGGRRQCAQRCHRARAAAGLR